MKIEFELLNNASQYFENKGFKYLDVPWVVSQEALKITCPDSSEPESSGFVASGEQSFLELALQKKLRQGKFHCITPCCRFQDKIDKWHYHQFYKLELIEYFGEIKPAHDISEMMKCVSCFIEVFKRYTDEISLEIVEDEVRKGCESLSSMDITVNGIEYGSYGIRHNENVGYWMYGTGVALPRFQQILEKKR